MSGRRVVKGKTLRATCPECGRAIACYLDRHALQAGAGITYLLAPHVAAPGQPCRGWRVVHGDLVSADSSNGDNRG